MKYFQKGNDYKHLDFKIDLANEMVTITKSSTSRRTLSTLVGELLFASQHFPVKIQELAKNGKVKQRFCHFCQHGRNPLKRRVKTSMECSLCRLPICSPSVCDCWKLHLENGMPPRRYLK